MFPLIFSYLKIKSTENIDDVFLPEYVEVPDFKEGNIGHPSQDHAILACGQLGKGVTHPFNRHQTFCGLDQDPKLKIVAQWKIRILFKLNFL